MFNIQKPFSFLMLTLLASLFFTFTGCDKREFVVSVDKPLRVLSISPSDGSAGVILETDIKVVFSEDILESTLNAASFAVSNVSDKENPVSVKGAITYDSKTYTAAFKPDEPLKFSSAYEVLLKTTIEKKDTSNSIGGNLAIETKSVFKTVDPDNLAVLYTEPGAGAWDVPVRKEIKIVFSHPVKEDTVVAGTSLLVEDITDPENIIDIAPASENGLVFSEDKKTITFNPANIYGYSRLIRITLTTAIATSDATAVSGFLKENVIVPFGTVNPPDLGIESVISGSGTAPMKHDVSGEPDTIVITFTEGIKRDSAALNSNIVVEDVTGLEDPETATANGTIAGELSWNATDAPDPETVIGADNIVTFTPASKLLYGTKVRVTVKGEPAPSMNGTLSDRATGKGGQLTETKIFLLDVETIPDLFVTGMTPGNISDQVPVNTAVTINFSEGIDCETLSLTGGSASVNFAFDSTDPEEPDTVIAASITPVCKDGDTSITIIPASDIKYSRDVKVVISSDAASLRARNINEKLDPLQGHLRNGYSALYSTIDPPALGVINVGTESGNFLMPVDDKIIVGFSEGVDQTTVVTGTSIIVEDVTGLPDPLNDTANGTISGSVTFNAADEPETVYLIGSDNTLTFTPEKNFPYGTKIRVTIPGSESPVSGIIMSDRATARGGQMTQDVVFLLQVVRLEELRVINTIPAHDNRNVSHAANQIKVTFSAAPDCGTINDTNIIVKYDNGLFTVDPVDGAAGTIINGSWECNVSDPVVTFTASNEFGYGRDFAVMLSSDIRDARAADVSIYDPTQGYLVPEFNFGFGTEHLPKVQIISNNAAGSISFQRDLPIELIFDPEIDCTTITGETVYVYRADSVDPVNEKLAATLTCSDPVHNTVTITALDDTEDTSCDGTALCYDTPYVLVVKGGYTGVCVEEKLPGDVSDDGCIESPEKTFNFRTEISPALSVTIIPPHDTTAVSPSVKPECIFSKPINTASVESEPLPNPDFPAPDGTVPNICLVKGYNKNSCDDPDIVELDPVSPYTYTEGDTKVTINPAATLATEEWYTVIVSRDIEDTTGVRLTAVNTASFRTSPGGLLNRVYVEGDTLEAMIVVAEFNEDVDVDTVHEGTFYLTFKNEFGGTTLVPAEVTLSNWSGGGACDPASGNENCDMAVLTPDFMKLYSCGETNADIQFELPMNTNFKAHLSTFIKNANYSTDPEHVPSTGTDNEFIYAFITPEPSAINSVTYSNIVVGSTTLDGADEVPVNASIKIMFNKEIDPASINSGVIEIEDGRGEDGITTSGSIIFSTSSLGNFKASDTGKKIRILSGDDTGSYTIVSIINDHSVNLDSALSASSTAISWSKLVDTSLYTFTSATDNMSVTVKPDKNFLFSSNYSGYSANVTGSTVTIDLNLNNYKVNTERDLGRKIMVFGSANAGNNIISTITGVNETANSFTVNSAFTSAENGLKWKVFSDSDHHILKIKGRTRNNTTDYIKDIKGNPVPGVLVQRFRTSPETHVTFNPDGVIDPKMTHRALAIFSRAVISQSVSENTLYYLVGGVKYYTVPTFYSHDLRMVLMTTIPSFLGGFRLDLVATSSILDFRGNPVIAKTLYVGDSSGAPSSNAITPSLGTLTPVTASVIKGDQRFRITWPTNNDNNLHSMNGGSINDATADLVHIINTGTGGVITNGSKTFTASGTPFSSAEPGFYLETSGAGVATDNGRWKITGINSTSSIQTDHTFTSNSSGISWTVVKKFSIISNYYPNAPDTGDIAEFQPVEGGRDAKFMPAGANIRLKVYFSKIANLYNIGATSDVTYNYTVESTPPELDEQDIKAESETFGTVSADGAADIKSDSRIHLLFNENIDPDTIFPDSVKLKDKDGIEMNCNYRVDGNVVTVIPYDRLLSTLSPYEVTVTSDIKDVAGNALTGIPDPVYFSVETTQPSIISTDPANSESIDSIYDPLKIVFSERMNPVSVAEGIEVTFFIPFECNSPEATGVVEGCISVDRKGTTATFAPYNGQFIDEYDFVLNVYDSATDTAGNSLAGGDQIIDFATIGGDTGPAVPLCSDLPVGAGEQYVDVYYSEDLDPLSFILGSITVYDTVTSEEVSGVITLEADGSAIRFTADAPFVSGRTYGVIITDDIQGIDGLNAGSSYHAFFTAL